MSSQKVGSWRIPQVGPFSAWPLIARRVGSLHEPPEPRVTVLLLVVASLGQAPQHDATRPPPRVSSLILAAPVNLWASSDSSSGPSAIKHIGLHTAVGTGAGLLIGLLVSSSSTDDQTTTVLTWTALGAAAGLASGLITWLVDRPR